MFASVCVGVWLTRCIRIALRDFVRGRVPRATNFLSHRAEIVDWVSRGDCCNLGRFDGNERVIDDGRSSGDERARRRLQCGVQTRERGRHRRSTDAADTEERGHREEEDDDDDDAHGRQTDPTRLATVGFEYYDRGR